MRKEERERGFTLIELLVVISIIAILAAILFPVFSRAREQARRASCASNLRQISLGVQQYTQDYDEKYPLEQPTDVSEASGRVTFVTVLQPYIKSQQIFICPSGSSTTTTSMEQQENKDLRWRAEAPPFAVASEGSYGLNQNLTRPDGLALSAVAHPTTTALAFDASWYQAAAGSLTGLAVQDATSRHSGGINVAYVDGHVKWANMKLDPYGVNFDIY